MRFSKWHQPKNRRGGRKPSEATIAKKQAELRAERERQEKAFFNFTNAESGDFNGFAFVDIFHEKIDKRAAIFTGISDDCADIRTPFGIFHTGADGMTAYFFSEQPKKTVSFNRSIYFF